MAASRWAFAVVALSIAIPLGVIAGISLLSPDLRNTLMQFQTLIGASVALGAAVIAFANVRAQIESTRLLELERREFEMRQLASALIGELAGFVETAHRRNMVAYYRENAAAVRARGRFEFWDLAASSKHDVVFAGVGAGVGLLPDDNPERVVLAYALIASVFDRMSSAAAGNYNQLAPAAAASMLDLLADEAAEAIDYARRVIGQLRAVQVGESAAPTAAVPPTMPGPVATLRTRAGGTPAPLRQPGRVVIHPPGRR